MALTSDQLQKTLCRVENLIAGLETAKVSRSDYERLAALQALRHQRAWLRGLLAVRRLERPNKVVSLDLWRSGFDMTQQPNARVS